jgi:predicted HTH transcriptional regulator
MGGDYDNAVETVIQSAKCENSKCKNCTLDCTLEELAVLRQVDKNPKITQKELAAAIGKSERTIKIRMRALQEKD